MLRKRSGGGGGVCVVVGGKAGGGGGEEGKGDLSTKTWGFSVFQFFLKM